MVAGTPPAPDGVAYESIFAKWLEDFGNKVNPACRSAGEHIGRTVLSWSKEHPESALDLPSRLNYVGQFVTGLHDALNPESRPDAANRGYSFWTHVDVAHVIQPAQRLYREHIVDRQALKQHADLYLARPWMHDSYLDWIITDALVACEFILTYERLEVQCGGVAYALFGQSPSMRLAFMLIKTSLVFFVGWILPGLLCWWAYPVYPKSSLIIGAVYYVAGIIWTAVILCRVAFYKLRGGKSARETAAQLKTVMFNAYRELRETTIHVPSLKRAIEQGREAGVVWDPQLYCLLDSIAQKHPSTWTASH